MQGHATAVAGPVDGVNDGLPSDPAIGRTRASGVTPDGRGCDDRRVARRHAPVRNLVWAERAAEAERAVRSRSVRRLAGVVQGTRIGRVAANRPASPHTLLGPWHYWWQAHLLDCLLDAQLREPSDRRGRELAALVRGIRLRNLGRWTNDYYDDIAWLGLVVRRAGVRLRRTGPKAVAAITARLRAGHTPAGGGGIWWRRGDDFKNAPANGPAAILLARTGDVARAVAIVDWMAATLVDPDTGLVRDGIRPDPVTGVWTVEGIAYTYCQGVYLGACVELAERDGDPRWARRAAAVVEAVREHLAEPDGVIGGYDDGGDGGLFNGILVRYLADAAVRLPALAPTAAHLVTASAERAWENRATDASGPVFAHDWRRPARQPRAGTPESALSVQLSGWMLLEAAARLERGR
ncbi:MAG: glycoside hydrolase family 76 [Pseudonocardia sp.]|jgi:predicted alpha-1,6-mannanase (GH76 family)|nr:glycoside hydrolase family 76 [Pseudonocardia sp.]MCU1629549.1 glycoside hydrolase family 76 [Pseudonocardia sp.]